MFRCVQTILSTASQEGRHASSHVRHHEAHARLQSSLLQPSLCPHPGQGRQTAEHGPPTHWAEGSSHSGVGRGEGGGEQRPNRVQDPRDVSRGSRPLVRAPLSHWTSLTNTITGASGKNLKMAIAEH